MSDVAKKRRKKETPAPGGASASRSPRRHAADERSKAPQPTTRKDDVAFYRAIEDASPWRVSPYASERGRYHEVMVERAIVELLEGVGRLEQTLATRADALKRGGEMATSLGLSENVVAERNWLGLGWAVKNVLRFAVQTLNRKVPSMHEVKQIDGMQSLAIGAPTPRDLVRAQMCNLADAVDRTRDAVERWGRPAAHYGAHDYAGLSQQFAACTGGVLTPDELKTTIEAGIKRHTKTTGIVAELVMHAIEKGKVVWTLGPGNARRQTIQNRVGRALQLRSSADGRWPSITQSEWSAMWGVSVGFNSHGSSVTHHEQAGPRSLEGDTRSRAERVEAPPRAARSRRGRRSD